MGLRGPGAKSTARADAAPQSKRRGLRKWQWKKLSRPERVIAFLQTLTITSGPKAGKRFRVLPHQRAFIESIYGPTRRDGRRVVREALYSMARKGGKTGLVSGLALCHLVGPEAEPRGQVIAAAVDRNQAALIYDEAKAFIEAAPELSRRVVVRAWNKSLEDVETGSVFRAISADAKRQHGLNPSLALLDEVAQWPTRELYEALRTAGGGRANPLMITISTQSDDPNSVMSELVHYAKMVAEGTHDDPSFVGFVYAAPDNCELDDEAAWLAANPGLPYGLPSIDELRTAAAQAKRIPSREPGFRLLHLNQPVSAEARFIGARDWLACGDEVDVDLLRGARCTGGLDLSSTQDLTAFALYFPDHGGAALLRYWLPAHEIDEREKRDRVPYRVWEAQGFLELIPGRAIDQRHVARRVAEIISPFACEAVAFDRWRIADFRKTVEDEGLNIQLYPFGQGFMSMSPAIDELERAVLDRRLKHGGNPVLTWNAASAVVDTDAAGNRKLSKAKATGRIDGLVALVMAIGRSRVTEGASVYSDRGLAVL